LSEGCINKNNMKDIEVREKFKNYFEKKGHKWFSSIGLVPDDPTMLFTTAGMVQFKKQLLGDSGSIKRAASLQKCLRTSDIEEVGKTARHLTFFEMYGNFSFGGYFKEEAISWSWEFLTEILSIPREKLYPTVYKEDDEAYKIWENYVPRERIYRLGDKDNFWTMGETGPCGPCSEILYDRGEDTGCGRDDCRVGCDCDRYVEVWNLVFAQYDRQSDGSYKELPKKNIDTGMGLERLNQVLNGLDNVYQTETIKPLMDKLEREARKFDYSSARIISDHARSVAFLAGEGVTTSNEGRGYVLRRLIRRALRECKKMGFTGPKLWEYATFVTDFMGDVYPELQKRADHIAMICKLEEETFLKTLDTAEGRLREKIKEIENTGGKTLGAQAAFTLYDTYGMPLDITKSILREKGLSVDEEGFKEKLKKRAESTKWKKKDDTVSFWEDIKDIEETPFMGYEKRYTRQASVLRIIDDKAVVLDSTPMYPEGGGQKGDCGTIKGKNGVFRVENTIEENRVIVHTGHLEGKLREGENVEVAVDKEKRRASQRNHTATHLLQSILRKNLGRHVKQSGSLVSPERLRFDFTHPDALSKEELDQIEEKVNEIIINNLPLKKCTMKKSEAEKKGALAFFGEKYEGKVRTVLVQMPENAEKPVSIELCGGTHVSRTGEIGLFKIVSESGVSTGVRRIEALTGLNAFHYVKEKETLLGRAAEILKIPEEMLEDKILKLKDEKKKLRMRINNLENKLASGAAKGDNEKQEQVGSVKFILRKFDEAGVGVMRAWADSRSSGKNKAVLACGRKDSAAKIILKLSGDMTEFVNAGDIVKKASKILGGGGGGRDDMAQGGGPDAEKIGEAVNKIKEILKKARP